ncbi:hypothetical protein [Virgibacillus salexigens]|uniref:Phage protein n=1 Tax=Virgibacillus kapii TaxID=1638645 RepID=A0ABQ2DWI4_9BACI|nr:hypothetical protein [Virgibacillus kapii]GGJ75580.1 hypothetical protein GCM10007111_41340 [Virgibacillus kapii]
MEFITIKVDELDKMISYYDKSKDITDYELAFIKHYKALARQFKNYDLDEVKIPKEDYLYYKSQYVHGGS